MLDGRWKMNKGMKGGAEVEVKEKVEDETRS